MHYNRCGPLWTHNPHPTKRPSPLSVHTLHTIIVCTQGTPHTLLTYSSSVPHPCILYLYCTVLYCTVFYVHTLLYRCAPPKIYQSTPKTRTPSLIISSLSFRQHQSIKTSNINISLPYASSRYRSPQSIDSPLNCWRGFTRLQQLFAPTICEAELPAGATYVDLTPGPRFGNQHLKLQSDTEGAFCFLPTNRLRFFCPGSNEVCLPIP